MKATTRRLCPRDLSPNCTLALIKIWHAVFHCTCHLKICLFMLMYQNTIGIFHSINCHEILLLLNFTSQCECCTSANALFIITAFPICSENNVKFSRIFTIPTYIFRHAFRCKIILSDPLNTTFIIPLFVRPNIAQFFALLNSLGILTA